MREVNEKLPLMMIELMRRRKREGKDEWKKEEEKE